MARFSEHRVQLWHQAGQPRGIPVVIMLTAGLLAAGLSLPVMQVAKLAFWKDSYSLLHGTFSLLSDGYWLLGGFLLIFSVLFPVLKLLALAGIWFLPMSGRARASSVWWTSALGRWSMLDVFVVALLIVLSTSSALVSATPALGLYLFGVAVLSAMWLSFATERVERRLSFNQL